MKIEKIYNFLDSISPFCEQEAWDNSGLLLGSLQDDVETVYLSLDIDEAVLEACSENSLLITHHPLIFKSLKNIANHKYPNAFIKTMIRKNIALISMHTNYDKSHLNAYFTEEILGFKHYIQDGFLIYVDLKDSFSNLLAYVKEKLGLPVLKYAFAKEELKKIAICTGSGGDLINDVKADCFLSGDFKYHQALEALSNGLNLIELGHFESESCFVNSLSNHLQNLPLKVIITNSKNPFKYH